MTELAQWADSVKIQEEDHEKVNKYITEED